MIDFNNTQYPYASSKRAVFSQGGMVATSQPLAAEAGAQILRQGGNAVDAAIATAACLSVVEPTSNGIGGDAFALVWIKEKMYGLNASGKSPKLLTLEKINELSLSSIPRYGFVPITVPGTPSAWVALSKRFGKMRLIDVLMPAIKCAQHGFPVSPIVSEYWQKAFKQYQKTLKEDMFKEWFRIFAPSGNSPKAGEVWSSIDHANTLTEIAMSEGESFYQGRLAQTIEDCAIRYGGLIRKDDLMNHAPMWVDPISTNYRGYDVWEIPPNGQGMICLQALNIIEGYRDLRSDHSDTIHKQIEAMKLAFTDGLAYISDIDYMHKSIEQMLSKEYATKRRMEINDNAIKPECGKPSDAGTVYLATADAEGNMVSYIQSNYMGFGSGIVVPNTGIALHNRGCNFSLDPNHPNVLGPSKRPYHTIIPGFLTKNKQAIGPFGVMGGFMQPQGHMQVVMHMIDFHLNPQAALDAPRWQWEQEKTIVVESTMPKRIINDLKRKGHIVKIESPSALFGRGQIIIRDPKNQVLIGGTDFRADGGIAIVL